jgi:hypothetical protein
MFAGHLGAGLLLKRVEPKIGLGTLFFSVMLLDALLWIFIVLGIELIRVPNSFNRMADLQFDFPYSHGLLASIAWSLAASIVFLALPRQTGRALFPAGVIGLAVFSHFILDWVVHVPELPLAGRNSPLTGLGLWKTNLPLAWVVEIMIVSAGLAAYLSNTKLSRRRLASLLVMMVLVTALTILGQASQTRPPAAQMMAGTSLVTIGAITAIAWWIESSRTKEVSIR